MTTGSSRAAPWCALSSSLLLLLATSCRSLPHWLPGLGWRAAARPHCPIELVPSEELAPGRWRARIEVRAVASDRAIGTRVRGEIAARVDGGVLRIAGVTPFGTRAFSIVQRGRELEIEDALGHRLGLEPLWILDAFHRSRLTSAYDRGEQASERIEEGFEAGRLSLRRFAETPPGSPVRAEVVFSGRRLDVRNEWCGYALAWLDQDP